MSDRAVEDVCHANPFLDAADVLQLPVRAVPLCFVLCV